MATHALVGARRRTERLTPRAAPAAKAAPGEKTGVRRWTSVEWFIVAQTALPAVLLLPGTQLIRLPLRVAAFAISLLLLAQWFAARRGRSAPHPAEKLILAVMAWLAAMIFHPTTNTVVAGVAQWCLYLSVVAPIFWAPRHVRSVAHARTILLVLLVCSGVNSVVGVLQVYDPGRWMPAEISARVVNSEYGLAVVSYPGPDGTLIIRPPGLFDNPGAVAGPAMFAGLLGVVFAVSSRNPMAGLGAAILAAAGITAIYLSFVRTSLFVLAGMFVVYVGLLLRRRQIGPILIVVPLAAMLTWSGFVISLHLGGQAVAERFATITEQGTSAYSQSGRAEQLEYGFGPLLSEFPLGAGLGRWGMMHEYFGDPSNVNSPSLWAELQPNAWIIDGGIVLVVLYGLTLIVTMRRDLALVRGRGTPLLHRVAMTVVAANMGVVALVFGFAPFTTQIGAQFWVLTGVLHGAACREQRR